MGDLSRRRLFGLFAGVAAAPIVGKALPAPGHYGWTDYRGSFGTSELQMLQLVQSRINAALAQASHNIALNLYGPEGAPALLNLTEYEDDG